jgi:hypothetical protein
MVVIEFGASGVGNTAHVTEDKSDGPRRWECCCGARGRLIEQCEDALGSTGKVVGSVDGTEEGRGARVREVADLETELGEIKVSGAGDLGAVPGPGGSGDLDGGGHDRDR